MHEINGVLITHEHSDHISGLKMLTKHHKLPIFAPKRLARELAELNPNCEALLNEIPLNSSFSVGGFNAMACHTPHDAVESVAYRIEAEKSFALATDMGYVCEDVRSMLEGVDAAVIESNYDEQMLRTGPYPYFLKNRISSDRGHLSNNCSAELAAFLDKKGTEKIVLGHLSRENNRPDIALKTVSAAISEAERKLLCAPAAGFMDIQIG